MKRQSHLIYYDNIIINMSQCISLEFFPEDNSIVLIFTNKSYVFRELEYPHDTYKMLEKAMKSF